MVERTEVLQERVLSSLNSQPSTTYFREIRLRTRHGTAGKAVADLQTQRHAESRDRRDRIEREGKNRRAGIVSERQDRRSRCRGKIRGSRAARAAARPRNP